MTTVGSRYVFVLETPSGEIAAGAIVRIDEDCCHLDALGVSERYYGHKLEDRMIAIAEALCQAYGCASLDVPQRAA